MSFFFLLYNCTHVFFSCHLYWWVYRLTQQLSSPFPCCLPADAGYALCLCGVVQEESWPGIWAAGYNQQLCMKDASAWQPVKKALWKSKGASLDMSTVDFRCSYISSSTPFTIHDNVANTDDVVGREKTVIYWHTL